MMRFASLLFVTALCADAEKQGIKTAAPSSSPATKVVSLLTRIQTQIQNEGKEEAAAYDKFACFCKDQADNKQYAIEKAIKTEARLTAEIDKATADKAILDEDIATLDTEVADLVTAMDLATTTRNTEHDDYTSRNTDLELGLVGIDKAINLTKGANDAMAAASLQEMATSIRKMNLTHSQEPNAYSYQSGDIIQTFLDLKNQFRDTKYNADKEEQDALHSHEMIQGDRKNVKHAKEKSSAAKGIMSANLASKIGELGVEKTATETAHAADQAFLDDLTDKCEKKSEAWDARSQVRTGELTAIGKALDLLGGAVDNYGATDDTDRKLGIGFIQGKPKAMKKTEGKKEGEKKEGKHEKKHQVHTKPHAMVKHVAPKTEHKHVAPKTEHKNEPQHKEHKHEKPHAMVAVKEGHFEKVGDKQVWKRSDRKNMAMDGHAHHHKTTEEKTEQAEAVSFLQRSTDSSRTRFLALLGDGSKFDSVRAAAKTGSFAEIEGMLNTLIAALEQEALDAQAEAEWCGEEMTRTTESRDETKDTIARLAAEIDTNKNLADERFVEIAGLSNEIAQLTKALNEETTLRDAESKANAKKIEDSQAGENAVAGAISVLEEYYAGVAVTDPQTEEAGESPVDSSGDSVDGLAPDAPGNEQYGGSQNAAGHIIGLMQEIETDFQTAISDTQTAEDTAVTDFTTFKTDTEASILAKQGEKETKEGERAQAGLDVDQANTDTSDAKNQLKETELEITNLKPACSASLAGADARAAEREQEITILNQGIGILQGTDFGEEAA